MTVYPREDIFFPELSVNPSTAFGDSLYFCCAMFTVSASCASTFNEESCRNRWLQACFKWFRKRVGEGEDFTRIRKPNFGKVIGQK